jgi:hypothetical protein
MTFECPIRAYASLAVGVVVLLAVCSRPGSPAGSSGLKPIDQSALQTMIDTTAGELLIPGAVVFLRTPQVLDQIYMVSPLPASPSPTN